MPHIQILDTATSNRIAAGEVVERPASIVKELVENALDAGATAITVEAREGGIGYLRVTDNGSGFPTGEVRVAFERHATSKLRSGDTLEEIATLGFRGEALPSIAAVARVELTTRQMGQETGIRLSIEGGAVTDLREAGCPEGTTMVVRDLFFNTPARKAFLKKPSTEGGYVGDAVLQLALSRCDISFRLVMNGRTVFHTPGDGDLLKTIQMLFGRDIQSDLVPIQGEWGGGSVSGFVGLQDAARANRQREYFIVNGRFVRSPLLALALEEAAKGSVAIGKYPFCVLRVSIPLGTVDVNVHPNKLEVRFRDEAGVRSAIQSIVSDCLRPQNVQARVPLMPPETESPTGSKAARVAPVNVSPAIAPHIPSRPAYKVTESGAMSAPPVAHASSWAGVDDVAQLIRQERQKGVSPTDIEKTDRKPTAVTPPIVREIAVQEFAPQAERRAEPGVMPIHTPARLIGTLFSTYVLVENGEEFLLIDQHAAHERLLYEQLRESIETGASAQALLIPYTFDVTPRERDHLLENMEHLCCIGFAIEEFGPTSFRVAMVPHILGEPQLKDFFVELLDNLGSISSMRAADLKRDAIARIACHKAVKAGDRLGDAELTALLEMVMREDTPLTCPHGRPILLRMTRAQIEKRFRRMQ